MYSFKHSVIYDFYVGEHLQQITAGAKQDISINTFGKCYKATPKEIPSITRILLSPLLENWSILCLSSIWSSTSFMRIIDWLGSFLKPADIAMH